jgi:hypothetical protein
MRRDIVFMGFIVLLSNKSVLFWKRKPFVLVSGVFYVKLLPYVMWTMAYVWDSDLVMIPLTLFWCMK